MTDEAAGPRRPAGGQSPPDGPDGVDRDRTAEVPSPSETPAPAPSPPASGPSAEDPAAPPETHAYPAGSDWREQSAEPDPREYAQQTPGPDPHAYAAGPHPHAYAAGPDPGEPARQWPGSDRFPPGETPLPGQHGGTAGSGGTPFTSRYGLVRPREGRYLAGVCAAIGRATNTDPVLWRVLLAVLGFFGGIGIVVYVAAWLIIPAEGDTASPVESMLGRGRSSMSPILVIILGILVAVLFGYIVTDTFRAILLGAAVLIGGALLLNRDASAANRRATTPPAGSGWDAPPATVGDPASPATQGGPFPAGFAGAPTGPPADVPPVPPSPGSEAADTVHPDPASAYPSWYRPATPTGGNQFAAGAYHPHGAYPAGGAYPVGQSAQAGPPPVVGATPTAAPPPHPGAGWPAPPVAAGARPSTRKAGYRPPFAPHGPYAPAGPLPPAWAGRQKPPKPPKPPRERSPLGAATFSMIFVAIGVVAILDLVNAVAVHPSTYFAAVLTTIALGLLVGAWFGRARWLIALGLVTAAALGISTLAESYEGERADSPVIWRPTSHDALAVRYQARFGDATLDLRQVDFTGQDTQIEARVDFGTLRVILPPTVDTTVVTEVNAGDAKVFDTRWSGLGEGPREVTDLGADGAGGGALKLSLMVKAGDAEVTR